ncbi:MAG: dUTP diphosphatase, partial [Malacoplasma sp.]|nr:dUTP diphosphatase [Malacoplasma sp.]
VGMITPRSGLSCKGLTIINSPGIIDSDYRGELMINFFNCGSETISWKAGDRIAQILFVPVKVGDMTLVPEFSPDKFENTRNEDGFGSTGEN